MSAKQDMKDRRNAVLALGAKRFGSDRVMTGDDAALKKDTVPTGIADLDAALGGGLRRGRVGIIAGQESMGKTVVAQWIIAAFQRQGYLAALVDAERTYSAEWYAATGVSVSELIVAQPTNTEATFDLIIDWAKAGVDLIVIDSLTALTPSARLSADLNDQEFMGLQPRRMSEGLNKFTSENDDAVLLGTSQLRSKVGKIFGSPEEVPGGRAMKHYSTYVIRVTRKSWITEGQERVGHVLGIEVTKNKLAPPFGTAEIPFLYSGQVDVVGLALDLGVIAMGAGGYYTWNGEKHHGRKKLVEYFHDSPDQLVKLREIVGFGGSGSTD